MNLLTDTPPETVQINGKEYPINTDARVCIKIMTAFEDDGLTQAEKCWVLISLLYKDPPEDLVEAYRQAGIFLNGGVEHGKEEEEDPQPRVFSWTKDGNLIYAAFNQTHGIDLAKEPMHWWRFLALFMDLGADTAFCSLVNLRRRLATGKATREEKDTANEMGDIVEVPTPDDRTIEEREAEILFNTAVSQRSITNG
jgi:hypothetical protein